MTLSSENIPDTYTLHIHTIRVLWGKQTKGCIKVIEKLQESGLITATFYKSFVELSLYNITKFIGNGSTNLTLTCTIKGKKRNIKGKINDAKNEKKQIEHGEKGTPLSEKAEYIADLWNVMAKMDKLPLVRKPLGEDRLKLVAIALKEFPNPEDWKSIVAQVGESKFRLGHNDRKWKANFDWLFHKTKFNYRKLWEEYESESGDWFNEQGRTGGDRRSDQ